MAVGTGSLFSRSTSKGWLTTKLNPCFPLACSRPIRVAVLPLTSSVRITARSGVALDGVGFSVDGKGALLRQPSNAAPTQAPPEARNERRERTRTKALPLSFPERASTDYLERADPDIVV